LDNRWAWSLFFTVPIDFVRADRVKEKPQSPLARIAAAASNTVIKPYED
jgi:hypothetical protein